jgi:hypothetical protein
VDEVEARTILNRRVSQLRQQPYEELKDGWLAHWDSEDYTGLSGVWYQVEIGAFWDDEKARHLRVLVSIDTGGQRGLTDSFIIAPDGSFIGE